MLHLHTILATVLLASAPLDPSVSMRFKSSDIVYFVLRYPNGVDRSAIFTKRYWDFFTFADGGFAAWNGTTFLDLTHPAAIRSYTTIKQEEKL